jgi:hypothetical protein
MKESKAFVALNHLPEYLSAFFPALTTEALLKGVGNFVIVVPDHMDHGIDVKQLLEFRAYAQDIEFSFMSFFPDTGRKHDYMHARKEILNQVLFPKLDRTTGTNKTMLRLAPSNSRIELRFERGYTYETGDAERWSSFVNIWFSRTAKEKWMDGKVRQTRKYDPVAGGLGGNFIQLLGDIKDVNSEIFWHVKPSIEADTGLMTKAKGLLGRLLK